MYIWRKSAGLNWLRDRIEPLTQRFGRAFAVVERTGSKRALLEVCCRTKKEAEELVREFGGSVERLRRDWLRQFTKQAQAKPLRIGSRLVVLRTPEKGKRPKINHPRTLVIPAEAAFGTGEHATTAMCLRLLEQTTRHFQPGWTMLDAGTGSGILALAGSYFGAGRTFATDNDPLACATAKRNARANCVRNIEFSTGDILKQKLTGRFEIITANLFSEILIEALPIWSRSLAPRGHLILSGILRSQESAVVRALRRHRFTALEIRRRGKWVAMLVKNCRPASSKP